MSPSQAQFSGARAKLKIASVDDNTIVIEAQYNPKELQIDKQIPWNDHKQRDDRTGRERQESSEQSDVEFNSAPKRSMQIEFLFDGYENGISVEPRVQLLNKLSTVEDFTEPQVERRPHYCIVTWGAQGGMSPFLCVIESLSTKYTMWDANGMVLRATCTVKLKEAERKVPRAQAGSRPT